MARALVQRVTFNGCAFTIYEEAGIFHTADGHRSAATLALAPSWQDLGPAASLEEARARCQDAAARTPREGIARVGTSTGPLVWGR